MTRKAGKRIRLLATGGTIASVTSGEGTEVSPRLTGTELLASVPEVEGIGEIEIREFSTIPSTAITPHDMHALAREVRRAREEGYEGVVVTHGTGTIEETAYALALMVPRALPVVLTGALRNPTQPGCDGPANLWAAFLAAADPRVARLGPLVVLNDELHTARWVMKTHTSRTSSFASPGASPVGEVVEGRVHLWFEPAYEDYVGFPDSLGDLVIDLVRVYAGADEAWLQAVVDRAPDGIVVEAIGPGLLPPQVLPAVDAAIASSIELVIASRCPAGRNFERTYRMPGSETDLAERGALFAGALSGHKARLRLLVGKALGLEAERLFPVR